MDIVAHTLWAGIGLTALRQRQPVATRVVVVSMVLAALPDVFQMLPVVAWWWFGDGTWGIVKAFATALPDHEPPLPSAVQLWSHHLHCLAHSALIAGLVTGAVCWQRRALWLPLLGWWSHIVIDVFTHSADFYPSPVLYPLTQRGFDGIAWNTPWFVVANDLSLAAAGLWLLVIEWRRRRPPN